MPMTLEKWRDWRRQTGGDLNDQLWVECPDPTDLLGEVAERTASERKLRLYACACCRMVWHNLVHQPSRDAIAATERFADGLITLEELGIARATAKTVVDSHKLPGKKDSHRRGEHAEHHASAAAVCAASAGGGWPYWQYANDAIDCVEKSAEYQSFGGSKESLTATLADLLRDIFCNPHRPINVSPNSITPAVVALAQAVYDNGSFERLPTLADALEEAGCDNRDILDHCRGPGPHVRGCWAVDLVLGKS